MTVKEAIAYIERWLADLHGDDRWAWANTYTPSVEMLADGRWWASLRPSAGGDAVEVTADTPNDVIIALAEALRRRSR